MTKQHHSYLVKSTAAMQLLQTVGGKSTIPSQQKPNIDSTNQY
jgi:hypothetical protein